jgi:uncharacterized membrane protein YqaE (UPF0057 family)
MILFLCYVFPPLAVLLMGRPFSAVGNMFCCLFFWVPGVKHALVCYADYKVDKSVKKVTKAINRPEWTRASLTQSEGRLRSKPKRERVEVSYVDAPDVGRNGTQFRRK